jgi:hypothetical protein
LKKIQNIISGTGNEGNVIDTFNSEIPLKTKVSIEKEVYAVKNERMEENIIMAEQGIEIKKNIYRNKIKKMNFISI